MNVRNGIAFPYLRPAAGVALLGLLLAAAIPAVSAVTRAQDGPATEYVGPLPAVTAEVPLDPSIGAVLHVSFLLSGELLDPVNRRPCRVVSVFTFTTVRDQVQYTLCHINPVRASNGNERIETGAGFDQDGNAADYTVFCEPKKGLTWRTVRGADDLTITPVKVEDKR